MKNGTYKSTRLNLTYFCWPTSVRCLFVTFLYSCVRLNSKFVILVTSSPCYRSIILTYRSIIRNYTKHSQIFYSAILPHKKNNFFKKKNGIPIKPSLHSIEGTKYFQLQSRFFRQYFLSYVLYEIWCSIWSYHNVLHNKNLRFCIAVW